MIFEARVRTVEAIEPTVCVDALASLLKAKSFSVDEVSSTSSPQFSCSYCCLFVLIQNLQTRYVTIATTTTPPMTPPAIAPAFGPDFDEEGVEVGVDWGSEATQETFAHSSQVGGVS